jgi:spore germination cell wall hydrolase CwlJ-like protein
LETKITEYRYRNQKGDMMFASKSKSILLLISCALLAYSFPSISQEITEAVVEQQVSQDFNKQLKCLADNVYFEAGNESYEGKLAVAQVTVNRANNPKFGGTICEVVYQRSYVNKLLVCQFSWTCMKNLLVRNKYAYDEAEMVARKALTEPEVHDIISKTNAMYYHNTQINPNWNLQRVTQIGNHIFYKEKKI